jgi:hypothetical protein
LKLKEFFTAAALFGIVLWTLFPSVISGQKTLLPTSLPLQLYRPYVESSQPFNPVNHFEDDVLRWIYDYKKEGGNHLFRPYWNSRIFGGVPQYANTYATHFAPSNVLINVFGIERGYSLVVLFHFLVAGLSMFCLSRSLGVGKRGALLAGITFMLAGSFSRLALRFFLLGPVSVFPWVLMFYFRALRSGATRDVVFASLFLAWAFLEGFVQANTYLVIALFTVSFGFWSEVAARRRIWTVLPTVLTLAMALSAIMWVPTLEYLLNNVTSRMGGHDYGKTFLQRLMSLPMVLAAQLMPSWIGFPRTLDASKLIRTNLQDFAPYFGVIPFLFAASFWMQGFRERFRRPEYRGLGLLAVVALVLPTLSPLDRFLYFRILALWALCGAVFFGAYFDGMGERWRLGSLGRWVRVTAAVGVVLSVLATFFRAPFIQRVEAFVGARLQQSTIAQLEPEWFLSRASRYVESVGISGVGLWILLFSCLGILTLSKVPRKHRLYFVLGVVWLDLGWFTQQWLATYSERPFPRLPEVEFLLSQKGEGRTTIQNEPRSGSAPFPKLILPTNVLGTYGVPTLEGWEGLRPLTPYDSPHETLEELAALGVRFVVTSLERPAFDPRLRLVYRNRLNIYENPLFVSKIRCADRVCSERELKVQYLGNDRYLVQAAQPLSLARVETWYPGWSVQVGEKAKENVISLTGGFQGFQVPPGAHVVSFQFEPRSYQIGLWVSGVTLVFMGLLLLGSNFIGDRKRRLAEPKGEGLVC